jgi:L-amino acid N-acyltransferase YncA
MSDISRLHGITTADAPALARFLAAMPDGDRTFFKEDTDLAAVERLCADERGRRWLLMVEGDTAAAYLAVLPGVAWSSHVGELRLIVAPEHRRRGLGRALARRGLVEGVALGLDKIVVEVAAHKEGDLEMFTTIGFEPEALLKDHIRDRHGRTHDLVILSHDVDAVRASMEVAGLGDPADRGGPG